MTTATDEELVEAVKAWVATTGASTLRLRYLEDFEPRVYVAIAEYAHDVPTVGAGLSEAKALVELCEKIGTFSICTGCMKSTIFEADPTMVLLYDLDRFCITTFDDETRGFVRSCELGH